MYWFNVFDIIGTIAFAISGALAGMRRNLDLFGIITLSITTASCGGLLRDTFIGNLPPTLFKEPKYIAVSFTTALLTFIVYPKIIKLLPAINNRIGIIIILVLDAIGLGAFTALGAKIAIEHNLNTLFSVVVMGLITGVGGGVLRDVLVRDIPLILRKEIYASASIAGALVMYLTYSITPELISLYLGFLTTIVIRIISISFNINLPVAQIELNQVTDES